MRAGLARSLVHFERRTNVRTADGGYTPTWSSFARPWVELQPVSGRDFVIIARWTSAYVLTPKDRIRYGTRIFDLETVINVDEQGKMWQITAKEAV